MSDITQAIELIEAIKQDYSSPIRIGTVYSISDTTAQVTIDGINVPALVFTSCSVGDRVAMINQDSRFYILGVLGGANRAGIIYPFGGTVVPDGFLACDGSSYLRSDYPKLFGVIGTSYGSVDSSHFNVPDLRGSFALGAGEDYGVGDTGGEKTHTLTEAEMPRHKHNYSGHSFTNLDERGSGSSNLNESNGAYYPGHWFTIDYAGGSQAHNNMPPYAVVKYIISTR